MAPGDTTVNNDSIIGPDDSQTYINARGDAVVDR